MNLTWLNYTGLTALQSYGEGWHCAIQSDDLARFEDRWNEGIVAGEPIEIEARLRRYDGVFAAATFNLMPLHDASGNIKQWLVSTTFGAISSLVEGVEERRPARRATARALASAVTDHH